MAGADLSGLDLLVIHFDGLLVLASNPLLFLQEFFLWKSANAKLFSCAIIPTWAFLCEAGRSEPLSRNGQGGRSSG